MGRSMRRCEACGALGGHRKLYLSVKALPEPWASLSDLCFALCVGAGDSCHNKVTNGTDLELTERLRQLAADRLALTFDFDPYPEGNALDSIRDMIRNLEQMGWVFDEQRQEIVKAA